MLFKRFMILFMTLALTICGQLSAQETTNDTPWEFTLNGKGLAIRYDGIPITWKSSLYVVKPGWTGLIYNQGSRPFQVTQTTNEQGRPVYTAVDQDPNYRSTYTITKVDNETLRVQYDGVMLTDRPGEIECNLGYFNANLFANRPYKAFTTKGYKTGHVPIFPKTNNQVENDLAQHFKTLTFDTRLGKLTLDIKTDRQVRFFDARLDPQEWAKPVPLFWCGIGVPARPISHDNPLNVVMTIKITPNKKNVAPTKELTITPALTKIKNARTFPEKQLLVVPQPKSIETAAGTISLNDKLNIAISQPQGETRLEPAAKRILKTYNTISLNPAVITNSSDNTTIIRISNDALSADYTTDFDRNAHWFKNEEGQQVTIDNSGITIIAPSARGAFYGLHTLRQIITRDADGNAYAQKLTVKDFPTMKRRGAHWFPSLKGVPFHEKLIERVMAGNKMNYAVIQVDHATWNSFPDLADKKNAVLNEDLKGLVKLCRENFIEPIPLLNVPGHGQWMFQNGQNKDIVEDPTTPYAYCTKNPKSYEFIQTLMEEVIEVFQPKTFHLGHDEVTMRGQFPNPDCKFCGNETDEEAASRLVANHLTKLTDWLKDRNIKTMIWGDMMLHKGTDDNFEALARTAEAAKYMRDHLPKEVVVADWHYNDKGQYPSLKQFRDMGNKVIACTWFKPMNVYLFTNAAKEAGIDGIMQTTWCGYYPTEYTMERDFYQFTAFILAAEYSWSDRTEKPTELPYLAADIYNTVYSPRDLRPQDGLLVDLRKAQTVNKTKWTNFAPGWNVASLPGGENKLEGITFNTSGSKAVVIGNSLMSPKESLTKLTIKLDNVKAKQLAVLNGSLWALARDTTITKVIYNYADGSANSQSLITEVNSGGLMQTLEMRKAVKAWKHITPQKREMHLWLTEVTNPEPDKAISSITFVPGSRMSGWYLAALTILQ
ncbi:Beta-hexosaminidase [Poriferisphaera corsica]|uniref:beta-N-acetylhexosaminidase n=1 Tax=Poriferisphaera corsica TaxID=2528020 RepID=A0A517YUV6_9BACT|nr:family 20 glycosylhydrolase [Poriferisphaera corsica]QDU34017.1 Beta-hexosaminidase [Poriferisphaera corsica]